MVAVADAQQCQREGARTHVERVELRLQLLAIQDGRRTPTHRLQHDLSAEATHEHNAAEALQSDASAQQVVSTRPTARSPPPSLRLNPHG